MGTLLTIDTLHLALMRHCLQLTLLCPVSPTAFCVGSTVFLPRSSPLFDTLAPHFSPFVDPGESASKGNRPAGLILGDGYSRQIPGNTHAEANALANFRTAYTSLSHAMAPQLPTMADILRDTSCYATIEPCSVRTSGRPSCALELVRAKVKAVYLVSFGLVLQLMSGRRRATRFRAVRRGADFGGRFHRVEVSRIVGLEEECLKAARRGRT